MSDLDDESAGLNDEELRRLKSVLVEVVTEKFPPAQQQKLLDFLELKSRLRAESDRGCALIAAAYLDEGFERLLRARMVANKRNTDALLDQGRALSSFSTRIRVAYAMGLIPEEVLHDANIIRDIRNKFAHLHGPLSFNDPSIADQCRALKLAVRQAENVEPRRRFTHVMTVLYSALSAASRQPQAVPPGVETVTSAIIGRSEGIWDRVRDAVRTKSSDSEGEAQT